MKITPQKVKIYDFLDITKLDREGDGFYLLYPHNTFFTKILSMKTTGGTKLIEYHLAEMNRLGADCIFTVDPDNRPTIHLYEKFRFFKQKIFQRLLSRE